MHIFKNMPSHSFLNYTKNIIKTCIEKAIKFQTAKVQSQCVA